MKVDGQPSEREISMQLKRLNVDGLKMRKRKTSTGTLRTTLDRSGMRTVPEDMYRPLGTCFNIPGPLTFTRQSTFEIVSFQLDPTNLTQFHQVIT